MAENEQTTPWLRLKGKIADETLLAPKTCFDSEGRPTSQTPDGRTVAYIERNVVGKPWANHVALITLIMTSRRLDPVTVLNYAWAMNAGFNKLFRAFNLKTMNHWDPNVHMPPYLRGEVAPEDSSGRRMEFFSKYKVLAKCIRKWLESLSEADRQRYQQYSMPMVDTAFTEGILTWSYVLGEQQKNRKAETEAVVPMYAALRAEAHFRFSRISRLRQAYLDALEVFKRDGHELPFSFYYDEGGDPEKGQPALERLHFRIWDHRSFVLAHRDDYKKDTVSLAARKTRHFATQHFYLEFVAAEPLIKDVPPQGLWFEDILRAGVLGNSAACGDDVEEKQKWLRAWGYSDGGARAAPFSGCCKGVLLWGRKEAQFLYKAQSHAEGVFIPVEQFYVGCLFGLLATDIFTTTGARMNEALQIRLDAEGLVRMEVPAPAGAKDQSARFRYALRMIPKGERGNVLATYFIGRETERLIVKVARMLAEHYGLDIDKGEALPTVRFSPVHKRCHRFGPARYLFQYHSHHLTPDSIQACMRFLLHGMVFSTAEGKPVIVKAHLLRHAFATHLVHVEKMPVDIVRQLLHQKNIRTAEYYSKATEGMVAEAADGFLERTASHCDVSEILRRSPEELRRQYDEAVETIGPLAEVIGGDCTYGHSCIAQRMCVGCPAKVPDPAKREQIVNRKKWAEERVKHYVEEGLVMEAAKLRKTIRDCAVELEEMDMMEKYRKDETRVALIQIEPRRRT